MVGSVILFVPMDDSLERDVDELQCYEESACINYMWFYALNGFENYLKWKQSLDKKQWLFIPQPEHQNTVTEFVPSDRHDLVQWRYVTSSVCPKDCLQSMQDVFAVTPYNFSRSLSLVRWEAKEKTPTHPLYLHCIVIKKLLRFSKLKTSNFWRQFLLPISELRLQTLLQETFSHGPSCNKMLSSGSPGAHPFSPLSV